ncbi:helix-hairpin-helix domain-containing protein [Pseudoneobacillus sp. C159]
MKEWLNVHKVKFIAIITIIIVALLIFYNTKQTDLVIGEANPLTLEPIHTEENRKEIESTIIMVDIKGAVKGPGVYQAVEGERVIDLINKAGGFASGADQNQVNLSERVVDEMVIFVPIVGEKDVGLTLGTTSEQSKFVNINKATENELETLPGIGPAKAKAIIEYRETNGVFKTIEDLKKISGIGEKTFEKLAPFISVK